MLLLILSFTVPNMIELQPILIEKLRKDLTEKLTREYPGRSNNGINIKRAANDIDILAKNSYLELKSRYRKLSSSDKNSIQFINYLEKIDDEFSKIDPESSLSHSTLRTFVNTGGNLQPRVLHIFSLYLGFTGWYDFVDRYNELKEVPSNEEFISNQKIKEKENGILIFKYHDDTNNIGIERNIRQSLKDTLEKYEYSVTIEDETIDADSRKAERELAIRKAQKLGAKIVLWGNITNVHVKTYIEFLSPLARKIIRTSQINLNEFISERGEVDKEVISKVSILAKFIVCFEKFYSDKLDDALKYLSLIDLNEIKNEKNLEVILKAKFFVGFSLALRNDTWDTPTYLEKSTELLNRILEISESKAFAHLHLASNCLFTNRISEAIDYYKKVISIDTNYRDETIYKLGILHCDKMELSLASFINVFEYRGKRHLSIKNNECFNSATVIYYLEKVPSKLGFTEKKILGSYHILNKNFEKAIKYLEYCLDVNPEDSEVNRYLGAAYTQLGELNLAIEYLHRALEICPEDEHALKILIQTYQAIGDSKSLEECIKLYSPKINVSSTINDNAILSKNKKWFTKKWGLALIVFLCLFLGYCYTHLYVFNKFETQDDAVLIIDFKSSDQGQIKKNIQEKISKQFPDIKTITSHSNIWELLNVSGKSRKDYHLLMREVGAKFNADLVIWGLTPNGYSYTIVDIHKYKENIPEGYISNYKNLRPISEYIAQKYYLDNVYQKAYNVLRDQIPFYINKTAKDRALFMMSKCLMKFAHDCDDENIREKSLQGAIEILSNLSKSSKDPIYDLTIWQIYFSLGNHHEAEKVMNNAVSKGVSKWDAYQSQCLNSLRAGDSIKAKLFMSKMRAIPQLSPSQKGKLGILYAEMNLLDTAHIFLDQAIKHARPNIQYKQDKALVYAKTYELYHTESDILKSIDLYKDIYSQDTSCVESIESLGNAFYCAGMVDSCKLYLNRISNVKFESDISNYILAVCHYNDKSYMKALTHLKNALDINPSHYEATHLKAVLLIELYYYTTFDSSIDYIYKDISEAEKLFNRAILLGNNKYKDMTWLSISNILKGDNINANTTIKQIPKSFKDEIYFIVLGHLAYIDNKTSVAQRHYHAANKMIKNKQRFMDLMDLTFRPEEFNLDKTLHKEFLVDLLN